MTEQEKATLVKYLTHDVNRAVKLMMLEMKKRVSGWGAEKIELSDLNRPLAVEADICLTVPKSKLVVFSHSAISKVVNELVMAKIIGQMSSTVLDVYDATLPTQKRMPVGIVSPYRTTLISNMVGYSKPRHNRRLPESSMYVCDERHHREFRTLTVVVLQLCWINPELIATQYDPNLLAAIGDVLDKCEV